MGPCTILCVPSIITISNCDDDIDATLPGTCTPQYYNIEVSITTLLSELAGVLEMDVSAVVFKAVLNRQFFLLKFYK